MTSILLGFNLLVTLKGIPLVDWQEYKGQANGHLSVNILWSSDFTAERDFSFLLLLLSDIICKEM